MPLFNRSKDKEYKEAARLLADNRPREAVDLLREIITKDPEHVNARVSLAVGLMQMQDNPSKDSELTKEALRHLDIAADIDPKNPVPHFNKGVTLRHIGLKEEALKCFEQTLRVERRNALAILHQAEIHYELGHWEQAVELARLALIRDPGLEPVLGWVRVAMRKAGMLEDEGPVERPDK
ncbi:MAG: tetratricopeptide repeat protein [Candidatus Thorarchaeota archaeon]